MIGFIGLSHLGLNYSLATAAKGFEVVAYDPDDALASRCAAGDFPIEEPGFRELFARHRTQLRYTSDQAELSRCELVFYALDVQTNERNESDLEPLTTLIENTAPHLGNNAIAVVLSQVSPGYMRKLRAKLRGLAHADFYYQVETLIFGRAVERAMEPERFIVGSADPASPLPAAFQKWHAAFGCPVLNMRLESAELAKIAINFFLVSSVTTTNTLAEICEAIGADWSEIVPALRLDRRIGPHAYLKPGLGIAGGNLERDLVTVQSLAAQYGTEAGIVTAWLRNSAHRRDWALQQLLTVLDGRQRVVVAIWGLAYKADTHSTKNSLSLDLIQALSFFDIQVHDPVARIDPVNFPNLTVVDLALAALDGAQALVLITPWSCYTEIPLQEIRRRLAGNLIIDPYAVLDEAQCGNLGFDYRRLGSSAAKVAR